MVLPCQYLDINKLAGSAVIVVRRCSVYRDAWDVTSDLADKINKERPFSIATRRLMRIDDFDITVSATNHNELVTST